MALFPCSADRKRYRGAATHFYPALVRGNDSQRLHLRLCSEHAEAFVRFCAAQLEQVLEDSDQEGPESTARCSLCGNDPAGGRAVFVTGYPASDPEGIAFWGQCCPGCDGPLQERLLLANNRVEPSTTPVGPRRVK